MNTSAETVLVTGSMGCLGAWVIKNLVQRGANVIASDINIEGHATTGRPALLLDSASLERVNWQALDVTDGAAVNDLVAQHKPDSIVHLAGLQIPFCRQAPAVGAAVNVVGTVNIFEAARQHGVAGLAYASSLAVLGPDSHYAEKPVTDDALPFPGTLYGVYKTANEQTARIYWQDWQVGSVGLRPYTVYGVARDQGMTADIAKAVLAAAAGVPFHIRFDGAVTLQHADDVANIFINCAQARHQGAAICNLRNDVVEVADFVQMLKRLYPESQITFEQNNPLPFPADLDDAGLQSMLGTVPHTPLEDAVGNDVAMFKQLLADGKVDLDQLNA